MAGTLEVTDKLCWMPAGWVFDIVLERIASELSGQDAVLAEQLLAARTEANGGYLDLRTRDKKTREVLLKAADIAYDHLKREEAAGSTTLRFHEGLLHQFQQFRDMLHASQYHRVKQQ